MLLPTLSSLLHRTALVINPASQSDLKCTNRFWCKVQNKYKSELKSTKVRNLMRSFRAEGRCGSAQQADLTNYDTAKRLVWILTSYDTTDRKCVSKEGLDHRKRFSCKNY